MTRKVLIVEDDRDIADLLRLHLRDIDCEVSLARDGPSGLEKALREPYALIILDLMLPGMEGLDLCKRLRAQPNYTPILMLTAKSAELDRILGLEIGADDYITKPFSIREVLARVKALFRRVEAMGAGTTSSEQEITADGLTIDVEKRKVVVKGRPVELTAREFDLLVQFARHPGRVYTRSQLLDLVWGYSNDSYQHTVNSHINRLRAKIERDPAKPRFILTVWGVGYKFSEPEGERSKGDDV